MKRIIFILISSLIVVLFVNIFLYKKTYDPNESIVFIESFGAEYINNGMGFVYKKDDKNTYIITNYHVVAESNEIYIYNIKNKKQKVNLFAYDIYSDIAILQLIGNLNLEEIKIKKDKLGIGDIIYYFNIYDKEFKQSNIISKNNELNINNSYGLSVYNATAINGDIQKGNSGGPILNKNNEVVGILCLKDIEDNIGFYVSIESVIEIINQLETKTLQRPNLGGIFVDSSNIKVLNEYGYNSYDIDGVVVLDIKKDGIFYDLGIKKGDLILKINDKLVLNTTDMQKEIYNYNMDQKIKLTYYRDGKYSEVEFILKN